MRVEIAGVRKTYGRLVALDDVTVDMPAGARVALIGPNGSGKTTLTRVVMGMVEHEGQVRLDGRSVFAEREALADRIAYVPQTAPQMGAPVGEIVRAVTDLRGLPAGAIAEVAARLELDVGALAPRPFRTLSGGNRQKVLIALALAARPSLLILDEPTASLDARARMHFFALARELAGSATVLLSSHRLEEIRSLVDHVVALDEGHVVYHGPAPAYLADRAAALIEICCRPDTSGVDGASAWLAEHGFRAGVGGWWRCRVSLDDKARLVAAVLAALPGQVVDLAVRDVDRVELDGSPGGPVRPGGPT